MCNVIFNFYLKSSLTLLHVSRYSPLSNSPPSRLSSKGIFFKPFTNPRFEPAAARLPFLLTRPGPSCPFAQILD